MSDAVDVQDDVVEEEEDEERQSFLPPPTFPSALLADGGSNGADGHDTSPEPSPSFAASPAEPPEKQGILIRLGHRLCGFR
jgi:hypothetical protein